MKMNKLKGGGGDGGMSFQRWHVTWWSDSNVGKLRFHYILLVATPTLSKSILFLSYQLWISSSEWWASCLGEGGLTRFQMQKRGQYLLWTEELGACAVLFHMQRQAAHLFNHDTGDSAWQEGNHLETGHTGGEGRYIHA